MLNQCFPYSQQPFLTCPSFNLLAYCAEAVSAKRRSVDEILGSKTHVLRRSAGKRSIFLVKFSYCYVDDAADSCVLVNLNVSFGAAQAKSRLLGSFLFSPKDIQTENWESPVA